MLNSTPHISPYAMSEITPSLWLLSHEHSVFQETLADLLEQITQKHVQSHLLMDSKAAHVPKPQAGATVFLLCQENRVKNLPEGLDDTAVNVIAIASRNHGIISTLLKQKVRIILSYSFSKEDLSTALKVAQTGGVFFSKDISGLFWENLQYEGIEALPSSTLPANLSEKERLVLKHIKTGKTTKEIAALLHLSANTIAVHRKNIMKKMGARNVAELLGKLQ